MDHAYDFRPGDTRFTADMRQALDGVTPTHVDEDDDFEDDLFDDAMATKGVLDAGNELLPAPLATQEEPVEWDQGKAAADQELEDKLSAEFTTLTGLSRQIGKLLQLQVSRPQIPPAFPCPAQ